jgi:hypothetical protein
MTKHSTSIPKALMDTGWVDPYQGPLTMDDLDWTGLRVPNEGRPERYDHPGPGMMPIGSSRDPRRRPLPLSSHQFTTNADPWSVQPVTVQG